MELASFPLRGVPAPRVQLFVSDLGATGVVRNAVAIANRAAANGFDVRILTCSADGVLSDQVDPRVPVVELLKGTRETLSRRTQLRQTFLAYRRHSRDWRPDILFSAGNHGHLLSTFAWLGLPGSNFSASAAILIMEAQTRRHVWRSLKFRLMMSLADGILAGLRQRRPRFPDLLAMARPWPFPMG
jgi:hypothetical protein